jgi:hypothetical protein
MLAKSLICSSPSVNMNDEGENPGRGFSGLFSALCALILVLLAGWMSGSWTVCVRFVLQLSVAAGLELGLCGAESSASRQSKQLIK